MPPTTSAILIATFNAASNYDNDHAPCLTFDHLLDSVLRVRGVEPMGPLYEHHARGVRSALRELVKLGRVRCTKKAYFGLSGRYQLQSQAPVEPAPDADNLRGVVTFNLRDRDLITTAIRRAEMKRESCWRISRTRLASLSARWSANLAHRDDIRDRRWYQAPTMEMSRSELQQLIGLVTALNWRDAIDYTLPRLRAQLKHFVPLAYKHLVATVSRAARMFRKPKDKQLALEFDGPSEAPRTLYVVSCTQTKASTAQPAADLYRSPWFAKARAYVESQLRPQDGWVILSAKHGVLTPEQVIAPYDQHLASLSAAARKQWGERVCDELDMILPGSVRIVMLCGESYREHLAPLGVTRDVRVPMRGLGIGQQLKWLTDHTTTTARELAA